MDSDGFDDDLKQDGVNLIMPDRCRRKLEIQGGRCLRDTNVSDSSSGSLPGGTGSGASNPLGVCRLKRPRLYAARIDYHAASTILR